MPSQPVRIMTRWALVAALAVGGCDDAQQPEAGTARPLLAAAVVSDPATSSASTGVVLRGAASGTVVYVSLPPGTLPGAESATIRNPRTGATLSVAMVNGGFDPVA